MSRLRAGGFLQQPKPPKELTLRELWRGILPRLLATGAPSMPVWPPDAFALCAHALRHASAYVRVLTNWPPRADPDDPESWAKVTRGVSREWLQAIFNDSPLPEPVRELWKRIVGGLDRPLASVSRSRVGQSLLELLAIADEACSPLIKKPESPHYKFGGGRVDPVLAARLFDTYAHWTLQENDQRSLCQEIHPSRLRVLPKFRTPQRGLTLRSLSLFAGLAEGAELDSRFLDNRQVLEGLTLNLLVVPWPFEVRPSQFRSNGRLSTEMGNMSEDFGFFTFDGRPAGRSFVPAISQLIRQAENECGKISMVVLPELALSDTEATQLRGLLAERDCGLVAGVGKSGVSRKSHGSNRVQLYMPWLAPIDQNKHHRWRLDRSQIIQYSLGNLLHHEKIWWEHIDVADRRLWFLRLMPWLTLCVLICEDLARPDPAGDVVRAVGPNLVISLLMDGPQLVGRWASRHATTLADDPGSSVLTVTSLGMSRLSRPASGPSRERVIALWKEEGASSIEIELPPGHQAAVLSVSMKAGRDWAADGRSRGASVPSLTGVRYLRSRLDTGT